MVIPAIPTPGSLRMSETGALEVEKRWLNSSGLSGCLMLPFYPSR